MNDDAHRAQVREFLLTRRQRITPQRAGLPAYGGSRRRVKGLRRDEVALLAGVSVDYYVRLERGNLAGASDAVLEGVANALQLDEAEREHLLALSRTAGRPTRRARPGPTSVRRGLQQVLDAIVDAPAWVRNGRHDILATNSMAAALYSPVLTSAVARPGADRAANTLRFVYLDPAAREFFVDYDRIATDSAAMLRLEAGRNPFDDELVQLVGQLSTRSELFRRHWASQDVTFHRSGHKRLRHPLVGELDLDFEALDLATDPGLRLNVYTAEVGTPSADALTLLASWAATTAPPRTREDSTP